MPHGKSSKASLTLQGGQRVYAMARNLASQSGENSWQCAWGCVDAVQAKCAYTSCGKNFEMLKNLFPRCHDL